MLNFEFRGSNKRCAKSDRVLNPGEEFFSVLMEKGNEIVRLDYASEFWDGPPEHCIGWWKTKVETLDSNRVHWAPRSVLLAFFDQVRQSPDQADCAFITALLLARKKILTTRESLQEPDGNRLYLENKREGIQYEIPVVEISPERLVEIQDILSEKLFTCQLIEADSDESKADEIE
jgi:hypothetical protein